MGKRGTRLNHMPGGLLLRKLPTFLIGLDDAAHCMWLHLLLSPLDSFLHASKGYIQPLLKGRQNLSCSYSYSLLQEETASLRRLSSFYMDFSAIGKSAHSNHNLSRSSEKGREPYFESICSPYKRYQRVYETVNRTVRLPSPVAREEVL